MLDLTTPEHIWRRACGSGLDKPGLDDAAVMSMLTFHGLVMNIDALHAIECLTDEQVAASRAGYRCFGFGSIAGVIGAGQHAIAQGLDPQELEDMRDEAYAAIIDADGVLMKAYEADYAREPGAFASIPDA